MHYREPFHGQRTAKLPDKLRRLGVLGQDRALSVLDTCCGKGEALGILAAQGFSRLTGADALRHPEWDRQAGIRFEQCDVRATPFGDETFDAVLNLHALHHLGDADGVGRFLAECHRILKAKGRLYVIDFPSSPQIRLLFACLRTRWFRLTPGLRNFGEILDEEWGYLGPYLRDWPRTRAVLDGNGRFRTVAATRRLFLYYLCLEKAS